MIKEIKKLKIGKVKTNVELKKLTTYRLEGTASIVVYPSDLDELRELIKFLREMKYKYIILGNGSNVIFKKKYNGVIIKLDKFNNIEINDFIIKAGAGVSLINLAYKASRMGLTGLEFASGIPGTLGGAIYMNAGAYESDMGYVVSEVEVLTKDLEVKTLYNKDMQFHYRTSFLKDNKDYICLSATIVLKHGNKDVIMNLIEERKKRRWMTQPLEYPSAGSVFRNPPGDAAWRLVENVGLKGFKLGNAEVSDKHANFIINRNGASGEEIKKLIEKIQKEVLKEFNIELKVEQEFIE